MRGIKGYLSFNGNCREAMLFYKNCFGGKVYFQTIGDSPMAEKMPAKMKNCILHSTLVKKDFILMGTDLLGHTGLQKGNNIALMVHCSSEKEIKDYYIKLSEGGNQTQPLAISVWGALSGNLVDRYGNNWLLYFNKEKN